VHPGARNDALVAAAAKYELPVELLMVVAYRQGRFEKADAPPPVTLDVPVPVDGEERNDEHGGAERFGMFYLSPEQVTEGAQRTGLSEEAIRTEHGANAMAAAALIAGASTRFGQDSDFDTLAPARAGLTLFQGLQESPVAADLSVKELVAQLRTGFDVTTGDGERLELIGFGEVTGEQSQALGVGQYPPTQWIPSPNYSSRDGYPVRFVVIHDMEGTQSSAISVFQQSSRQSSAHYLLRASDGHIVQMVQEAQNAWHCGNGWYNRNSIGIEHEGFAGRPGGGGYYTETQYQASAQLVAAITLRYGIPVDRGHIFGHGNVPSSGSGGICSDAQANAAQCGGSAHHWDPGPYWNWGHFLDLVAAARNQPVGPPPPPPVAPSCGALASGASLAPGQALTSCNGAATLVHQGDGNVVLYDNNSHRAIWHTQTYGRATSSFVMQGDGNLVLYGSGALWSSGTFGNGGAIAVVQDDGNFVIYGAGNRALWATDTQVQAPPPPPPPPPAPKACGGLGAGASLGRGEQVSSCNGRFVLAHQGDGNVVLYDNGRALWTTRTDGRATSSLVMQGDGNLVLYNGGAALWASRTDGHGGATLAVQDDGNLVIYQGGRALWATMTQR